MTTTTVVLLVMLWGAVLVPGAWRDRRSSPVSTVDGFHDAMARIASFDGRSVMVPAQGGGWLLHTDPSPRQRMLARRRAVLLRLAGVTVATFATALVGGGAWWLLWTLTAVALGLYVATLRSLEVRRQQVRRVVRELHPSATVSDRRDAEVPRDEADVADELVELDDAELWREGAVVGGR